MNRDEGRARAIPERTAKAAILTLTAVALVLPPGAAFAQAENAASPAGGYTLSIDPKLLGDDKIELDVSTNIPGTIEVMTDVVLAGQKDDDLVIGTDGQDLTIHNGYGKTILDLVQAISGKPLPAGTYEADAGFYPNWGFKDEAARQTGIDHEIHASRKVVLKGSGNAQDVEARMKHSADVMDWVLDHGKFGDPWRPKVWTRRFGPYVTLPSPFLDRDPARVKQEYFPDIDWTVVVNVQAGIILTVGQGKEQKPGRLGGDE